MVRPGELRQEVRLEQRSQVLDSAGTQQLVWLLFAQRRAGILRLRGHEVFASQERQGRVLTYFKLRYLDGVVPSMRLICNEKVYDVVSAIDPDGMRAELLIATEEHVEEVP